MKHMKTIVKRDMRIIAMRKGVHLCVENEDPPRATHKASALVE
jgi:hypothetical protein